MMDGRKPLTVSPALTRWSGREILPGLRSSRHGEEVDEATTEAAVRAVMQALEMARNKGLLPSPTELRLDATKTCTTLPSLRWHHWDYQPYKMRLTNTGCTVMVSAKWRPKLRAHLTGGPLLGRYVFSQLHFHWGKDDTEGSEHTLEGRSFPLEMHLVLFKSRYLTQEAALKELDGVVEVAYLFQLAKNDNPQLEPLVQALSKVTCAMNSTRFGPLPLRELVPTFTTDYLLYMGSLLTGKCAHALTWIVRYQPLSISKRQLEALRSVQGLDGNPLLRNWRQAHPPLGRTVLHVLPSGSKTVHKGDRLSEEVPNEKRQTHFAPDWSESEPEAPPDAGADSPKSRRRFFGCFGKKSQSAALENESWLTVDSSGDSGTTDMSSNQPWFPWIASQQLQSHPEDSDSTFRAMCEASHLLSMSSSSQHSSTEGEEAHGSRQETAAAGDTERRHDVIRATKHEQVDMGVMLLEPPELRRDVGAAFFKPSERCRSVGVTFLDQKEHRRTVITAFNPLLSEVEEESERTSEAVADAADSGSECEVVAPEQSGQFGRPLPPLKSPSSVVEAEKGLPSMKNEELNAGGIGDACLPVELSTSSLTVPVSPSDSLVFKLSSPICEGTETSFLAEVNENSLGSVASDATKVSPNNEGDRDVTSADCKLTEPAQGVEDSSPVIPSFHRYNKGGISWWVPFPDNRDFTSDENGNDAEGSNRDLAQLSAVDTFSLMASTITDNCFGVIGDKIFTDTSAATDTPETAGTAGQQCTDIFSDSTVNLSSKESTALQSSEEQEFLATIWRSQIPDPGIKSMKDVDSLSLSQYKGTGSKNADSSLTIKTLSYNLYPDVATNASTYPAETYRTNDSGVSHTWSTRTSAQKRFDEEELRFPEIRIPKRNSHKPKLLQKRTSLSLSTLQDLEENNTNRSILQRTTKDGKVKDRLNSWREMQSRKRSSRKSENKKHNRARRRHHSSSSMDHLLQDSSSEDRSTMEKMSSKKFKASASAKASDTIFADGKSTNDGYECRRRERSNSSSSVSSILSSSGAKCIDKVVDSRGAQELIGSGNEMQLQEISFHYSPCRAGAAPLNRKHLITAADHGDSAVTKSPSKLRFHLKAPVDMSQLLKKTPSGSCIIIDSSGACVQEREVTVGMVLVDTPRCEDGRSTNSFSTQEITSVVAPQTDREKSEDTPVVDSKDLSISVPAEHCYSDESTSASQLQPDVDNAEIHQMETSEATTSNVSTVKDHSPHRNQCCNAGCWICQLSTIKVIQYTQGLDNSRDLLASEDSEKVVADTSNAAEPAGSEDEIRAPANIPCDAVERFPSVFSGTPVAVQCSSSNKRVPLPEPAPVGDGPQQENHMEVIALPSSQNEISVFQTRETLSTNPVHYRTTMELRLHLPGNSKSSSSGGERMNESNETSREVVSEEEEKAPRMAVYAVNSSSCEETSKTVPLPTTNDDSKEDDAVKNSTEIIDIYRKIKRKSERKNKLSLKGIRETRTVDDFKSCISCATDSDVSLIPDEDEAVPESSNIRSLVSGEDLPKSHDKVTRCTETSEESGRDHKSTLKRFRLEYDILSKVMLYATLRQLAISSTSVTRTAGPQLCPQDETCGSNEPKYMGDAFQPSLDTELVRSLIKVPNSQYKHTSTKATWTGPEELSTTSPELPASPQVPMVTPDAESRRETEITGECQKSLSDADGGIVETNCSDTQLLIINSEAEKNSRRVHTRDEVESRRETEITEERQKSLSDADGGIVGTNCSNTQLLAITSETEKNSSRVRTRDSVMLYTRDAKSSTLDEKQTCNDTEGESVADSQDMRDLEGIEFSSTSVSSNATKSQPSNKTETHKPSSVQGSVKQQKLCSVEVRNKLNHPGGEPQQSRRPKRPQSRDRILSPREVYERRKMYAKNLALRRAQNANHHASSEDGETRSNFGSEEKSTGESSQKEYSTKNTKSLDDHQSAGSGKLGEAKNKSVSAGKESTVKTFRDTADKTQTGKKARVATRTSENFKDGKCASSCSTCSTKNNSASSSAKHRTVIGSRSLRSDIKLPGARERTTRTSVIGHRRGDPVKEMDKASANTRRSSAGSDYSGGAAGSRRTSGTVAANVVSRRQPSVIQGQRLKSNTANDAAARTPTPRNQRCLAERQSGKNLDTKTSLLAAVELDCIEIIDKPSLCESWVKQHYSDSTLGSLCGSSSAETTVQTVIASTKKPGTELEVRGNPADISKKSVKPNESRERLSKKATGRPEGEVSTLPYQQDIFPSRKWKVSSQSNGEEVLQAGNSDRLMIPFRTDTVPLLTYKPQKLSADGLISTDSAHDQGSCSVKRTPPSLDSQCTRGAVLTSSQTELERITKIAKFLRGNLDEDTKRGLSVPKLDSLRTLAADLTSRQAEVDGIKKKAKLLRGKSDEGTKRDLSVPTLNSLRTKAAELTSSQTEVDDIKKKAKLLSGKSDEDTKRDLSVPTSNSLRTQAADLTSSQTEVDGIKKKSKLSSGKLDEGTKRDLSVPEVNYSTSKRNESVELRKVSLYDNKSPTTLSRPPSIHDKKSVATSPMPLRKQSVVLHDSRQMSLTVETFSFCSTGVNTSLSVTCLSSHSLGVQCPSQAISKRPSATTDLLQSIIKAKEKPDTHVYEARGMHAMLTEVATKLEKQMLVQKSVATQWLRHASVPNLALKSPCKKGKKTGKRKKRGSSKNRQGATSSQPVLGEYDLGLNEVRMEKIRMLHRRRLFRAFSTNSLALGTNEASTKKVMRLLFRKKKKKENSDDTEGKRKCRKKKKKKEEEEEEPTESAAASGSCRGGGARSAVTEETTYRAEDTTEATTDRSARSGTTHYGDLSDATGGLRKNRQHKLSEADEKDVSPRLLLLRGAETAQSPALFEDLEGVSAGSNWCSVHNRPADDTAGQGGVGADADEVSAAVAQVNTGAHVLRVSLADEESAGCSDLGSMEFVVGGGEAARQPVHTPSVLARLRQMLTWRS